MNCILLSINNFDSDCNLFPIKYYVKDIIDYTMNVVHIPFACDINWLLNPNPKEFQDFVDSHYRPFSSFGIPKDQYTVIDVNDGYKKNKEILDNADIIYFSGGFMENIKELLIYSNLWKIIQSYRDDKIFIGESAGALILLDEYMEVPYIEDNYSEYKIVDGLGIVSNINLHVHYDNNNKNHIVNKNILKKIGYDKLNVCLTNNAGLIIKDNETIILGEYYI